MVCHNRRRRRQATVQLAPLRSRHRRVHRDCRDHCRRHHCSHHRYHRNRRHHRRRNHRRCHGRRHHRRSHRRHQSEERRRREQRGRGGYRGSNDVSVRGRLVSNAATHPMAVLATGAVGPFESRQCPTDSGHVAFSPAPFTVGHRAVGRGRRFLLGQPSGVGTAVEWPPETKIRRQRFWRRTGALLLLLAVDMMVASTARLGLLYSASTSIRSTTASPRSSIPSTAGLETSTSNKRVWVRRHP